MSALDGKIKVKLDKGRTRHNTWKPKWAETLAFYEGRHFVYQAISGTSTVLSELETREFGAKPRYRVRTVRNLYTKYCLSEISDGVQRVPGYDVTPSTTDPDDISAAKLAEKLLLDLYERLSLRKHLTTARVYSVVCGEGFIRPWWNPDAGENGEICIETYGPDEVYWEAGCRFDKSPWLAIETARSIEEVKNLPGYNGAPLKENAYSNSSLVSGQLQRKGNRPDSVLLTEYLELPSKANPKGQRLFIANDQVVCDPEPYPMPIQCETGYEHVVHQMTYIPTPHRDRDMGLGEQLVDLQRTITDCVNKAIQWKNLAIRPQMLAPVGSIITSPTDEDGLVVYYRPVGGLKPEWKDPPPIPQSLFEMIDQAKAHMEEITSQRTLPPGITANNALQAVYGQDNSVKQFILQALADFHAKLGRHLLLYAQKYYDTSRLLQIRGVTAPDAEYTMMFKGSDLRNQVNVYVSAESVAPRTHQQIEQKVLAYADRGWISGQEAMAAIDGGYAQDLEENYELNISKQLRENQAMIAMNPNLPGGDVPIAKPYDNHSVHLYILHNWMLTKAFEDQPDYVQQAAILHEQQHQQLQAQQQAMQAQAQMQQAEQLGMNNAARPQNKGMPSMPIPGNNNQSTSTPA